MIHFLATRRHTLDGAATKIVLLAALLLATVRAAPGDAPADQYFGKLAMSTLRIRYEIMQLRPRYETHRLLPEDAEHLAVLDEQAFYAWAAAYPHDSWLASTAYLLAGLFEELPGADARNRAIRALTYVKTHFPKTKYANEAVEALHRGIPVRPDPEWAVAVRAERAAPSPTPSPSPSPAESTSPSPSPSPRATLPASPSPTATPTPQDRQ